LEFKEKAGTGDRFESSDLGKRRESAQEPETQNQFPKTAGAGHIRTWARRVKVWLSEMDISFQSLRKIV
jgi:hypothetical protein